MGMAASQARLLSITMRLTSNEFQSQMISNSKTRLANETQAASEEYMEALNATKLQYVYYDANGEKSLYDLTASTMLQYQPLKNQYALVNRAGQTMVNHNDATTFQQAANRDEFLELNDCAIIHELERENPQYAIWQSQEPDPTDPKYQIVSKSSSCKLYAQFVDAGDYCRDSALYHGQAGCYIHVLNHLIDFSYPTPNPAITYPATYDTSLGSAYQISLPYHGGGGMCHDDNCQIMAEVSDQISNGNENGETIMAPDVLNNSDYKLNPDGSYTVNIDTPKLVVGGDGYEHPIYDADGNPEIENKDVTYYTFNTGNADADLLLGNYMPDGSLKTLKQKIIDLYYVVKNYGTMGVPYEDLENALKNFQVDMNTAFTKKEFDKEAYEADRQEWLKNEPDKIIKYNDIEITDPDKAEWYTNLWYRMNGAYDDEELMQNANDDDYNNSDELHQKYYEKTEASQQSWVEFDDTLINSSEWLQFALESGEITLEKVVFNEDYDTTTELENKTWTAVAWSSTTDIVEVEDELAITRAEVKYNQAMREIQAKDKEYDNDIKKLDTEHNALQTEYDSIKSVMDKNMERSFKAFS